MTKTIYEIQLIAAKNTVKSSFLTKSLRAVQSVGGAAEAVRGLIFGVMSSWSGVGPVVGGAAFVNGIDNLVTGGKSLLSGNDHDTLFLNDVAPAVHIPRAVAITVEVALGFATSGVSSYSLIKSLGLFGKSIVKINNVSESRLQLEAYRTILRQEASWVKPVEIKNKNLFKLIEKLYRPNAKIGSGNSADAARVELYNKGVKVGGREHVQKAKDYLTALQNFINNNALNSHEVNIAENIITDLQDSLGDKLWYSQTNIPKL